MPGGQKNRKGDKMQEQQRILIADDEPEIREVLRMMLGSEGYEILEAVNAQEAVEQAERVDLVILDVMMPGGSGKRPMFRFSF